ncbi:hypothetical protein APHAL10511_006932 [Amanita phalloides]|nr:hypothetical protein APHAL10511_006932 [Amanita phalloides]
MPPPSLHAISPALFFLVPLFLLFISFQPTHRPAGPLLAQLLMTLLAIFAILVATLGLAALPKAEAIVESLFVLTLESSTVFIIYSLSFYRLYVNALIFLLSCATLLSFLSALLPHTVPSAISSALLIVFSLVSFPLLSFLIFPLRALVSRGRSHTPTSSQLFLNVPRDSRYITTSLGPSSIPFPSPSPTTSSTTIWALSNVIAPEGREDNFCDVDLEISSPVRNTSTSTYGKRCPSRFLGLLFIAQFLFLISYVLNLCSLLSTSGQLWELRTAQTTFLIISSFFTTFSYTQYVRSFLCVHDRVPGQATDSCDSSNSPTPFAKRGYTNISSTNDATPSLSKLNSLSTYESPAQYSLSPSTSMRFPLTRTEVSPASSTFALASHHVTPSGASQTLHVNNQESSKASLAAVTASSRYPDPTIDAAPLWIRTERNIVHRIDTHRTGSANASAKDNANGIYMPTPIRVSAPSLLFADDMGAATLDLPEHVPRPPTSDVGSTLVGTHLYGRGKKTPTLVHRDSAWSISSSPSTASVPIVRTLSSSSSLALSGLYIKPRSKKSMSSMSSRQLPLLAKCVPLDVLSRNMEIAENSALQRGAERDSAQDRRDRQALLRVDNGIGSRSRSISAASSLTVYEDLEWVASRLDTGKEKKRSAFLFGKVQQGREYKSQHRNLGQVDAPRSFRQHHQDGRMMSIGRAMRRRSLSISLLSGILGRQKEEEEVVEPISPSSSISLSTSSLLSSLSMSPTRSPASPVSHASLKTPVDSEPGSPNASGKKKSRYYWVPRKPKKDKGKKSRSASDLQQGRDKGQDQDQEQIGLMVEGPADFMDLRDPFAPPDLGTRGYSTRVMSDHIENAWSDSRSPSRHGFHGTTSPRMSLCGGLSLVVDFSLAPGLGDGKPSSSQRQRRSAVDAPRRVRLRHYNISRIQDRLKLRLLVWGTGKVEDGGRGVTVRLWRRVRGLHV